MTDPPTATDAADFLDQQATSSRNRCEDVTASAIGQRESGAGSLAAVVNAGSDLTVRRSSLGVVP